MSTDYLPKRDGDLSIWLQNFQSKIPTQGPLVGLLAADITDLSNLCGELEEAIADSDMADNAAQQSTATKRNLKKTLLPTLRNAIKRMKTHGGYTEAIGQDLNIIGGEADVPTIPQLKIKVTMNEVVISFTKKGLDGVNVYARLKGSATWTFLGRDTNSPYNDARPLTNAGVPETREYMCIGVVNDEEVTDPSDIVSAVFGG